MKWTSKNTTFVKFKVYSLKFIVSLKSLLFTVYKPKFFYSCTCLRQVILLEGKNCNSNENLNENENYSSWQVVNQNDNQNENQNDNQNENDCLMG